MAISLVLCYHLLRGNPSINPTMLVLGKIPAALWIGVDVFFVLSGFLITGILYDSLTDTGFFRKFYGRRTVRIFPLYYGLVLGLLLLTGPLHLLWQGAQWALLLYLQNTPLIHPIFHYDLSTQVHLDHLWSLAVEEQFYLVWPLLLFWIKDLRRLLVLCALGAMGALALRIGMVHAGAPLSLVYVLTPCRADSLLLGSTLALLMRSQWKARALAAASGMMAGSAVVLAAIVWRQGDFDSGGKLSLTLGVTAVATFSFGLIANVFRERSLLRPVFEQKWLRFLGKYSYGIYIYHFPLDSWLAVPTRQFLFVHFHSKLLGFFGAVAVVLAVTIVLSVASYQLYEKRFLKLKKYFEYDERMRTPALEEHAGQIVAR